MLLPRMPSEHFHDLKPSTQHLLFGKGLRARIRAAILPVTLSLYIPSTHGIDLLITLWCIASKAGEAQRVFGQYAQSPTAFVKHVAASSEILVAHVPGAEWPRGEGVYGFCGMDDVEQGGRLRLHQYFLPEYRQAHSTYQVGRQTLAWIFTHMDCALLYGLTPRENRAAVRYALRLGFRKLGVLPEAIWYDGRIVDAIQTGMRRRDWQESEAQG